MRDSIIQQWSYCLFLENLFLQNWTTDIYFPSPVNCPSFLNGPEAFTFTVTFNESKRQNITPTVDEVIEKPLKSQISRRYRNFFATKLYSIFKSKQYMQRNHNENLQYVPKPVLRSSHFYSFGLIVRKLWRDFSRDYSTDLSERETSNRKFQNDEKESMLEPPL